MARFAETFCSQCGGVFGPGDSGYSHCDSHPGPARERLRDAAPYLKSAAVFALAYLQDYAGERHDDPDYAAAVKAAAEGLERAIDMADGVRFARTEDAASMATFAPVLSAITNTGGR